MRRVAWFSVGVALSLAISIVPTVWRAMTDWRRDTPSGMVLELPMRHVVPSSGMVLEFDERGSASNILFAIDGMIIARCNQAGTDCVCGPVY